MGSNDALMASFQSFVDDLNDGRLDAVPRFFGRNFFHYRPPADEPPAGETIGVLVADLKQALPDLRLAVDDLRSDGDRLTGTLTATGTSRETLWGAPPTGRTVSWSSTFTVRPDEDGFALNFDGFNLRDLVAVLREINLIPPPEERALPHKFPTVLPELLLKIILNGRLEETPCEHLHLIRLSTTDETVCQACVEQGDVWPALRLCLICGFVGCCDQAKNHHMKQHYEETGHGIMRSIRLDEGWGWCYDHGTMFSSRTLARYYPDGS